MKQWIYEKGAVIGSFEVTPDGLYDEYFYEIHSMGDRLLRLYAVGGLSSHYLGIPDCRGKLRKKLQRKLFPRGASCLIASEYEKSDWCSWRGTLDGVKVEDGLLCRQDGVTFLALLPEEAMHFPAWADYYQEKTIYRHSRMLLQLNADGQPSAIERNNRRDKDEKDENSVGFADPQLSSDPDPCAGECPGDQGEGE